MIVLTTPHIGVVERVGTVGSTSLSADRGGPFRCCSKTLPDRSRTGQSDRRTPHSYAGRLRMSGRGELEDGRACPFGRREPICVHRRRGETWSGRCSHGPRSGRDRRGPPHARPPREQSDRPRRASTSSSRPRTGPAPTPWARWSSTRESRTDPTSAARRRWPAVRRPLWNRSRRM